MGAASIQSQKADPQPPIPQGGLGDTPEWYLPSGQGMHTYGICRKYFIYSVCGSHKFLHTSYNIQYIYIYIYYTTLYMSYVFSINFLRHSYRVLYISYTLPLHFPYSSLYSCIFLIQFHTVPMHFLHIATQLLYISYTTLHIPYTFPT